MTEARGEVAIGVVLDMHFCAAAGRADHNAALAFDFFGGDMLGGALF